MITAVSQSLRGDRDDNDAPCRLHSLLESAVVVVEARVVNC